MTFIQCTYMYELPQDISESGKSNHTCMSGMSFIEVQILEFAEIDQSVKGLKADLTSTNEIVQSILKTQDFLQQSVSTILSHLNHLEQSIIALIPVPQTTFGPDPNPSTPV